MTYAIGYPPDHYHCGIILARCKTLVFAADRWQRESDLHRRGCTCGGPLLLDGTTGERVMQSQEDEARRILGYR